MSTVWLFRLCISLLFVFSNCLERLGISLVVLINDLEAFLWIYKMLASPLGCGFSVFILFSFRFRFGFFLLFFSRRWFIYESHQARHVAFQCQILEIKANINDLSLFPFLLSLRSLIAHNKWACQPVYDSLTQAELLFNLFLFIICPSILGFFSLSFPPCVQSSEPEERMMYLSFFCLSVNIQPNRVLLGPPRNA